MKVWPDDANAKPTYAFFVNERIDLLVREAETFRSDYRNEKPRHVFLALKKPVPFAAEQLETMKFCGWVLLLVILACGGVTSWVIGRQNRSVT